MHLLMPILYVISPNVTITRNMSIEMLTFSSKDQLEKGSQFCMVIAPLSHYYTRSVMGIMYTSFHASDVKLCIATFVHAPRHLRDTIRTHCPFAYFEMVKHERFISNMKHFLIRI